MTEYNFSVDAELLRELGERLVGRPHIALAELIKNSYDADANNVVIEFVDDRIVISDDGHGMTEYDFATRWMRIGTTRKRSLRYSPRFRRPLTGSKGVGRLSAQLLARTTEIESVALTDATNPKSGTELPISAVVDWAKAVRSGELTSVTVDVSNPTLGPIEFPARSSHGTRVTLRHLVDEWDSDAFAELAREVWALRPPFEDASAETMSITLVSDNADAEASFARQMDAILEIWTARVTGELLPADAEGVIVDGVLPQHLPDSEESTGAVEGDPKLRFPTRYLKVLIELRDEPPREVFYSVPNCAVNHLNYEIRVFKLQRRQPFGIAVGDARAYLRKFGGIGIYDGGFKLPYYGVDQDWLNSERDHARRLDRSSLVPEQLQVRRGLLDLPTNGRVFGWVRVDTGSEEHAAVAAGRPPHEALSIQVTRDRLTDNAAYQHLRVMVRAALDLYAMEVARRKLVAATEKRDRAATRPTDAISAVSFTLDSFKGEIPEAAYQELSSAVSVAADATRAEQEAARAYASLLGALATAGSTSLAYEHEISKQVASLRGLEAELNIIAGRLPASESESVRSAVQRMHEWQERVAGIRAVFGPLLNKESREKVDRYDARRIARRVARDIQPLARGIEVDVSGVPDGLLLPPAALPAWTSIFQNLYINAYNALRDVDQPKIRVVGASESSRSWIQVQDNGVGVDLATANELWLPFERRLLLPPEQEAAGLGGMGLGLTIVKMIADQVGVSAEFVPPSDDMSTAVALRWGS